MFVELPPKDYQAGDEHMCGLLRHVLNGTRDAAQNWEEALAATLSKLKLTRGIACTCVWQGRTRGEHVVAMVRRDDITICGKRPALERLIKMISRKHEIKKPVNGEDADLKRSGRILNRVTAWGRDGITTEADHRHFREMLMDLHLERANHIATPCVKEKEKRDKCKRRRMQGERSRVRDGQTKTRHDWDDTGDKDGWYRVQMTSDGEKTVRHPQEVTSPSTEHP